MLHPYEPEQAERIFHRLDTVLTGGRLRWHPFFDSAYSGGGFTLGIGHANYLSAYNYIDVRGSYTFSGYKRAEVEFVAPRMFNRRGALSRARRLARSDAGRLLRLRHEYVEGRPDQLPLSAALCSPGC